MVRFRLPGLIGLAVVALAIWGVYAAWTAKQVAGELQDAADSARALRTSIADGQDKAAKQQLRDLQDHAGAAVDKTSGTTWSVLTKLPVIGDDAEGVQVVAGVVDEVSRSKATTLLGNKGGLNKLVPTGGRIDLDAVASLRKPVSQTQATLDRAVDTLAGQDPSGFIGPLRSKFTELQDQVTQASDAINNADVALDVLPQMLGQDGKRTYLLVLQNNAEIRATGGLPGLVAVITADDGKIAMTKQVAGSSLGETDEPVLPLTAAERKLYGPQLGTYFLDANFTPDFPRAADLMRARWQQEYDDQIDGVVMVDAVTMSYLLGATGPVTVDGTTLTADNAVSELLNNVYLRFEDPKDQDAFFQAVAATVFDKVSSGGVNPREMIRALARGASERRVYVHNFDAVQKPLVGTPVAGAVPDDPDQAPQALVTLNDTTGSKMSYYLRYDLSCQTGDDQTSMSMKVWSTAPADAANLPEYITGGGSYGIEPGTEAVTVRVYAPIGATIKDFRINGKRQPPVLVTGGNRQVAMTYVFVQPDKQDDLTWKLTGTPPVQTFLTPGVEKAGLVTGATCV